MNLTENRGLKALTVEAEQKEIAVVGKFSLPNHNPACRIPHLLLRAAFVQKGFGEIADAWNWHVMSAGRHQYSTLSMEGLKEWELL